MSAIPQAPRYYQQCFPPVTNRLVFEPERTPSPVLSACITNRRLFSSNVNSEAAPATSDDYKASHFESHTDISTNEEEISRHGSSDPENPSPEIIGLRRPPGPLSKPNSGGYLLKATLNWDNALYKSVQDGLRQLCIQHLNIRAPWKKQLTESTAIYMEDAIAKFPILRKYQGAWPAEDFASIYLKNSSCDYRQNTKRTTESYIGR